MKISYFTTHFPYRKGHPYEKYAVGGAEAVAYNLAYILAQKGHEISVFTTSADNEDVTEEYNGMKICRYRTNFGVASGRFSFGLLKNPVKYPTNLVHVHVSVPMGDIAGLRYAKKKNIPLVATYHGDIEGGCGVFTRAGIYFYYKYFLDEVLSHANVIISPSEYYINEARFLWKYRDKIVVIPNGINLEDFDIGYSKEDCREELDLPLDDAIILFLGGLSPHKGPDVLLKAMPKIIKEVPDAKLVLVGSGSMIGGLERLCKKMGVEKYVEFAGFVGDTFKKALYYRSADVFALPSTMLEIFGIVNLEAMACGIPIVASKIGGVPDVVKDGENGLLVPPGDSKALADAIIYLLENEDMGKKMGVNGRKKVEGYSWERIAGETEKVYDEVLG